MSGGNYQNEFGEPGWNHGQDSYKESYDNYESPSNTLSYHQQEKLKDITHKIKSQFDFLEEDEIQSAVIDKNFDIPSIDEHFAKFAIDEKYEGLEAYEWKQVEKKEFVNKKRGRGGRGRGRGGYNTRGRYNQRGGYGQYNSSYNNYYGN